VNNDSGTNTQLGHMAYEIWSAAVSENDEAFNPFECQPLAWQEAWRQTGATLWQAGFEAGSDFMSVVLTNLAPKETTF